jgi:hypothetical protein
MDIAYSTRSQFLSACETAIREQRAGLDVGRIVRVDLGGGGYNGSINATICPNEQGFFGADCELKDPTRFPARIRAAATALKNCECHGQFEILHLDGSITIRKI